MKICSYITTFYVLIQNIYFIIFNFICEFLYMRELHFVGTYVSVVYVSVVYVSVVYVSVVYVSVVHVPLMV